MIPEEKLFSWFYTITFSQFFIIFCGFLILFGMWYHLENVLGLWAGRCMGRWSRARNVSTFGWCSQHQSGWSVPFSCRFQWREKTMVWLSCCWAMDTPSAWLATQLFCTRNWQLELVSICCNLSFSSNENKLIACLQYTESGLSCSCVY